MFAFLDGSARVAINWRWRNSSRPERYLDIDDELGDILRRERVCSKVYSVIEIVRLGLIDWATAKCIGKRDWEMEMVWTSFLIREAIGTKVKAGREKGENQSEI